MAPSLAMNDRPNSLANDAEAICDLALRDSLSPQFANLKHLGFGQHRVSVARTCRGVVSPLRFTVSHVVRLIAQKEVVRVATGRIVAAMKDKEPVWNGAKMKLPRQSMATFPLVVVAYAAIAVSLIPSPDVTSSYRVDLKSRCQTVNSPGNQTRDHVSNLLTRWFSHVQCYNILKG